jgi:sec-independent protein translocase protein TatC
MPLDQLHEQERLQREKGEMSFFDHISELRKHILRAAAAILIGGIACFIYIQFVFQKLIFGPKSADFITFKVLCDASNRMGWGEAMCFKPPQFTLITRQMGEVLMQQIYVSFWLGLIVGFPYVLWEIWRFVSPGLYEKERKAAGGVILVCSLLFFLGVAFGYFIIAPFSISFLAGQTLEGVQVSPTLDSYVTYLTMFTIPTGLIFEMPVAAYFFSKIGLLGPAVMRNYRRHAVVALLIIAAVITPPDIVSQTMVFIPLYALYEVSIAVVARTAKSRARALDQASETLPQPYE